MAPVCLSSADHLSLVVTVPGDADIVSGARGEAVVAVSPWTVDDSDRAVGPWKHKQNYFDDLLNMKMSYIPLIP